MDRFSKDPAETYFVAMEYSGKLPTGAALSSGALTAVNAKTGATDETVLVSTTATISGTQSKAQVQAGVDGQDYIIKFTNTLDNSDVLKDSLEMEVRSV